jgi:hypothetical protein
MHPACSTGAIRHAAACHQGSAREAECQFSASMSMSMSTITVK